MKKQCVLEDRECTGCGECDRCDLDPKKKCDNCGKCIDSEATYRGIGVDDVLIEIETEKDDCCHTDDCGCGHKH